MAEAPKRACGLTPVFQSRAPLASIFVMVLTLLARLVALSILSANPAAALPLPAFVRIPNSSASLTTGIGRPSGVTTPCSANSFERALAACGLLDRMTDLSAITKVLGLYRPGESQPCFQGVLDGFALLWVCGEL